jgi:hypothetical protein
MDRTASPARRNPHRHSGGGIEFDLDCLGGCHTGRTGEWRDGQKLYRATDVGKRWAEELLGEQLFGDDEGGDDDARSSP